MENTLTQNIVDKILINLKRINILKQCINLIE